MKPTLPRPCLGADPGHNDGLIRPGSVADGRARRTFKGIDEQVAKTVKAVEGAQSR